jgi:hypothetical protein
VHPKHRLQITPPALLFHCSLKLQQTGMLEKHHRKPTHQGVMEGVAELRSGPRIVHSTEGCGQQVDNCF